MAAHFPGNVPIFEEHSARVEANYTIPGWYRLTPYARAMEVAHYRLRKLIDAHASMKQEQEAAKESRKGKRR